ncbi:Chromosome transmission fidelity protein 18 [Malassezia cuniculi]|uniref:Chromosome transmission fidelity protein 18 n=1 Tax=Malassezia cuniculi TaxID=948313 RepID=A0AAF0EZA0_9BASI|nr:Chromosome transmission fidelity protein 18 [Malassezia cuniculi]
MPPRTWRPDTDPGPDPEDELDALLEEEELIAREYAQHVAQEVPHSAHQDDEPEPDALFLGEEPASPRPQQPEACEPGGVRDDSVHATESTVHARPPTRTGAAAQRFAASASRSGVPKYIPAEPLFAVTTSGVPVTIPRRRRLRGWQPERVSFDDYADAELLERPLHQVMERLEHVPQTRRQPKASKNTEGPMWVDKYRPQNFSELLGDERVHRNALRWLKEWDPCVFNREAPRQRGPKDEDVPRDPYGRPAERVLLISGPPGLGKTTLAHVIAHQAGYRVYELNASDTRSAAGVDERVRMALESDSLRGEGRPTLVVIDEIDGATGGSEGGGSDGFVRALVRLIERGKGAPERKFRGQMAPGPHVGRSRRKTPKPLLRPIICICNDLYAPALRTLRQHARILRYNKSPPALIARRLSEICAREQLKCDTRSLMLLSDLTNGDIRSCLHALQMIHAADGQVNEKTISDAAVGIKDSAISMNSLWEQLFRNVNTRTAAYLKGQLKRATGGTNAAQQKNAHQALLHEIISYGEYDKLALACFEHYLHLRVPDDGWSRYAQIHEWLHFSQSISQRAWGGSGAGSHELFAFQPYTFLPWHMLFANIANPLPDQPPRADYETQSRASPESREALQALVSLMIDLGFSFQPSRTEDGVLVQRLEPALDLFGQFGDAKCDVGPPRHGVRQHVQREIETETERRRRVHESTQEAAKSEAAEQPKKLVNVDFFGRPVESSVPEATSTQEAAAALRVFYRYHEGYSNAVRKGIKLRDLL